MKKEKSWITRRDEGDFRDFVAIIKDHEKGILLRNDIVLALDRFFSSRSRAAVKRSTVHALFSKVQEILVGTDFLTLLYRASATDYRYLKVRRDGFMVGEISGEAFLTQKERLIQERHDPHVPVLDFGPFSDFAPQIRDPASIGHGIQFLSRHLGSEIFQQPQKWNELLFRFLKLHEFRKQPLLVNGNVLTDFKAFYDQLVEVNTWLQQASPRTTQASAMRKMRKHGFEMGWGDEPKTMAANTQRLLDLLHAPNDRRFEAFVSQMPLPLLSKVVIVSPHGWFAQENALGKPDTGGQVIYILDQVRALEAQLSGDIQRAGLNVQPKVIILTRLIPQAEDTTCDMPMEKVHGTQNAWIMRVPFHDVDGQVLPHWISRFDIWPFLERFAEDAVERLKSEFQGNPDLVVGNYSDGNMVATILSRKLDVIQCNIAHALEKTKYLFSDLYWKEMEPDYHFSLQFTADLLAMNAADFIVTSTHQEITGTQDSVGQYESYRVFSLPGLYRVVNGISLTTPKFNVIPPGVDSRLYFPYFETGRRSAKKTDAWRKTLFHDTSEHGYGHLQHPEKPALFTMARLDRIKNIPGLVEAYGLSPTLQKHFNLIIAGGVTRVEASHDREEKDQIQTLYRLIHQYDLSGRIRWLPAIPKLETGEVYRVIADQRGLFVQPALFEAFGLTVLEAMASGLPAFGTCFGGPSEIIQDGVNGFLINTSQPGLMTQALESFLKATRKNRDLWEQISKGGIERVHQQYTWDNYSERLCTLTKLYGFWRFTVPENARTKSERYGDLIHHFLYHQRARAMVHTPQNV